MLLQGLPLDGRVVKRIKMGGWIRTEGVEIVGRDRTKAPSVAIQYFDEKRNRIGFNYVGALQGTNPWQLIVDEFEFRHRLGKRLSRLGYSVPWVWPNLMDWSSSH